MRFALAVSLAAAFWALPALADAQEVDKAIFHYSRLELDASRSSGSTLATWEGNGWIGTDFDRLWWSTEGERFGSGFEDAEFSLLYGHYARRFWDVVVGVRHEVEPVSQSYVTFGIMGLAPYWFEVELFGAVSDNGRASVRLEAETDLFVTQRLILEPLVHFDALIVDDPELGLEAGTRTFESGFLIRYEIRRKFAPYLSLKWVSEQESFIAAPDQPDLEGFRLGLGVRLIY
jgi:copper resistance protein B